MAKAPFVIIPEMCAVAAAYRQKSFIADDVCPRVPVATEEFKYQKYPAAESFTFPETAVGRKGAPNQVEFTGQEVTDSTVDHALDAPVPNKDLTAYEKAREAGQTKIVNPLLRATSQVMQLVDTAREKRTADLVFGNANYGTNNKTTLSGTGQWSDFVNSNPQTAITDAIDSMIMRPNIATFGRATWSKLSQHPKICAAIFKQGTTAGKVSREQFAELFELQDVFVGDGWINTAKKGQPANIVRLWGKHAAFLHRDMNADTEFGITFAYTAVWGDRVAGTIEDPDMGMRGGVRARAGESLKELVVANDLGYLFMNAVA